MKSIRYVYWQDGEMWLGYLEEYPDYRTQGETLEESQENLKDIFADISSGAIPA
jgi:predicted RNase H-like HicB family nuclease